MKLRLLAGACAIALTPSTANAITFVNAYTVSGTATDLSGLPAGPNGNRLGGIGSDLIYDASRNLFMSLPDRGPGGGTIDYAPRYHAFKLDINKGTGAINGFSLDSTTLLKRGGINFTGLNPLLATGSVSNLGQSLDPEGLARLANGNLLISDEYGPSLYEFTTDGAFVRAFTTPQNLIPTTSGGTIDYVNGRPTITSGRQDNRGFEGVTVSADGKTAYAVMQDPLVNEGASNDGRRSRNVRIVAFDTNNGLSTGQYVYRLEDIATLNAVTPGQTFSATNQGRSIGLSGVQALADGRLMILERDNRGQGVDDPTSANKVALKSLFLVDLTGATDVSALSLAGSNSLPGGVMPVAKSAFLDVRQMLFNAGIPISEKIEGMSFGPRLADGGISLILATDNDFSVTQNGNGTQFDVCTSGVGGIFSQVALGTACAPGQSLIPNYFYSFRLSRDEALSLGFAAVPEPATWAFMLGGFWLVGGAMRQRRKAMVLA